MAASVTLVRGPGQELRLADALSAMGRLAFRQGDLAAARHAYEEALAVRRSRAVSSNGTKNPGKGSRRADSLLRRALRSPTLTMATIIAKVYRVLGTRS